MQFQHEGFSCEVDIFTSDAGLVARFYDKAREHQERDIINLVVADPGYGYLCLKRQGEAGLLSGFLSEQVFASDDCISQAIEFVESLAPWTKSAYVPHHVDRIRPTTFVEYNGEY